MIFELGNIFEGLIVVIRLVICPAIWQDMNIYLVFPSLISFYITLFTTK